MFLLTASDEDDGSSPKIPTLKERRATANEDAEEVRKDIDVSSCLDKRILGNESARAPTKQNDIMRTNKV